MKKMIARKRRVRAKVVGTDRPRLSIHKTNKEIYAQIIDDSKNKTVAAFSSLKIEKSDKKGKNKKELSEIVGENIAKLAKDAKVKSVVFDRSGFKYHGRVKALADAARKAGLEF